MRKTNEKRGERKKRMNVFALPFSIWRRKYETEKREGKTALGTV